MDFANYEADILDHEVEIEIDAFEEEHEDTEKNQGESIMKLDNNSYKMKTTHVFDTPE